MNRAIGLLIEFIVSFLGVYLIYVIFIMKKIKIRKSKKNKNKPKKEEVNVEKEFIELNLFIKLNNLDESKLDKKKLMNKLALLNAFDVSIILLLTELTDNIFLKALIAFVAVFIIMFVTYKLYGLFYRKKEK